MTDRAEILDRARRALQIADEVDAAAVERLQRGINDWQAPAAVQGTQRAPQRPVRDRAPVVRDWAAEEAWVRRIIDARQRELAESVGEVIGRMRAELRSEWKAQLEALRLELRKESAEVLQSEIIGRLDKMAALIDLVAAGQGVLARLDGTVDAKKPH